MVRSKSILRDPTGFQTENEAMIALVADLARWRDRVVVAADGLDVEGCGCRDGYVARVRRLAAIIREAPGDVP